MRRDVWLAEIPDAIRKCYGSVTPFRYWGKKQTNKRVVFLELPGLCTLGKRVQQCHLQTCDQALGSDQAQICRTPLNGAPFTRKGYSHRQGKGLEILSHNSARSYFISVVFSLPRRQPATKAKLQPLKNSLIKNY